MVTMYAVCLLTRSLVAAGLLKEEEEEEEEEKQKQEEQEEEEEEYKSRPPGKKVWKCLKSVASTLILPQLRLAQESSRLIVTFPF